MPFQIMVVAESQSRARASSSSSFALFTTNVSRCASAAMNLVFPLHAPFAQMTPQRMPPEADGCWTRCGNERQRLGCLLVQPWVYCAHGGGKQEAVGHLPHTWNVHTNALSARYIL
jgi:hypothetical protein